MNRLIPKKSLNNKVINLIIAAVVLVITVQFSGGCSSKGSTEGLELETSSSAAEINDSADNSETSVSETTISEASETTAAETTTTEPISESVAKETQPEDNETVTTEDDKTEPPISPIKKIEEEAYSITFSDNAEMEALIDEMLAITDTMTANVSIYYHDLLSGDMISINGDRQYRSASTAKIFVVMAMYDAVAKGNLDLDQIVYYDDSDYEGGSGIMQNMDLTQGYKLGILAEYAIKHSDNIAFKMIRRITGRDNCFDYYESIIGHSTNRESTHMSAEDAGKLLQHAYESSDPNMKFMLELMKNTDFEDAIPRYLPENMVSNKIGFYLDYFHDAAIIHDNNPYILTIFTKSIADTYNEDPAKLLAEISRTIYSVR